MAVPTWKGTASKDAEKSNQMLHLQWHPSPKELVQMANIHFYRNVPGLLALAQTALPERFGLSWVLFWPGPF